MPGLLLVLMVSCEEPDAFQRNPIESNVSAGAVLLRGATEGRNSSTPNPAGPAPGETRTPPSRYHCPGEPPTNDGVGEYSSPPVVENRREFVRVLSVAYQESVRKAAPSGIVQVLFLVDTLGAVPEVHVARSSGSAALDSAAIRGVSQVRFRPAYLDNQAICMWVAIPIRIPPPGGSSQGRLSKPTRTGGER